MGNLSTLTGGVAALALIVGGATPAAAQGWGRHGPAVYGYPGGSIGWGGHQRRHRDNFDFGDFLGVAAILGAVAVIASSSERKRRDERPRTDDRRDDDRRAQEPRFEDRSMGDSQFDAASGSEDVAIDACAFAARDEGSRDGLFAEVREVGTVRAATDGGWTVSGVIDQKETFRASAIQARSFTCIWRGGRVTDLVLSRETRAI
jgi:hypothetical protein